MSKKIFIIFAILFSVIFFINFDKIRSFARASLPDSFKYKVKEVFFGKEYLEETIYYRKLGYNVKKLPETQFENIDTTKITLSNLEIIEKTHYDNVKDISSNNKKFFIEAYKNYLIITSAKGKIKLVEDYKSSKIIKLNSNLKDFNIYNVLDTLVLNKKLFISFVSKKDESSECSLINIAEANIAKDFLDFKIFYKTKECTAGTNALGGRMKFYKHKNTEGLLLTTAASDEEKLRAQDDDSFYGKIWFFSLDGKEKILFSKGHRNPQGLLIVDGTILSTEHGPYGGDEINKIEFQKNYGFPHSSYGEPYDFKTILKSRSDYFFKKNHSKYSFKEPIFSFIPSIGISEIIKVPKEFSKYWQNNFLITSLNGRTIYRAEFDNKFTKLKYIEPIRVGERIRDIKYLPNLNSFVLALEETGSLLFLKVKKS